MTHEVTERDFRAPEFYNARVEDYEFRGDGKIVRKDRWEQGIQRIREIVGISSREFEIPEVVDAVRTMAKQIPRDKCEWTYNDEYFHWQTSCGNAHQFGDGGIKENSFTHCPYCGGGIGEKTP